MGASKDRSKKQELTIFNNIINTYTMKIAFTTKGSQWDSKMDPRFGRTEYFLIYDETADTLTAVNNKDTENEAHGAGPKAAQRLAEQKAKILITGNGPGGNAATVLQKLGVDCYINAGDMSVKEAYEAFKAGQLKKL